MKRAARRAPRAAAGPDRADRRRGRPIDVVPRVPRRAPRSRTRMPERDRRRPVAEAVGRALAPVLPGRRRIVAPQPAARHRRRARGPRAATARSSDTFASYGRYWLELFRLPTRRARLGRAALRRSTGYEHIDARARRAATGVILALPHLGGWDFAGARGSPAAGVAPRSWSSRSSRRSCSSGSPSVRAAIGMEVVPLGPEAGPAVLRALQGEPDRVPAVATATSPATASRSSSSASAPRCRAARRPSRCAPARRWCPPRSTSGPGGGHFARDRPAAAGASARAACATMSRGSPRSSPAASRS